MSKLNRLKFQKLFLKSKIILKTAFLYIKIHYLSNDDFFLKNIIVVPKKCGIAVRRNYIRRITKNLIKKYNLNFAGNPFIFIYMKNNLDFLNYNLLELTFIDLLKAVKK